MNEKAKIRRWMRDRVEGYVDECGEINCTLMVEEWDRECADGRTTLDTDHIAWDIAVDVAEEWDKKVVAEDKSWEEWRTRLCEIEEEKNDH